MKNLKIKFGLFSLLAILAVSVFLTSCEQETITDVSENLQQIVINENEAMILPYGYSDQLSTTEIIEYLSNISIEEISILIENNRIVTYLETIDKRGEVEENMNYGGNISQVDLSIHLNTKQLREVELFEIPATNDISYRDCRWQYQCCTKNHSFCDRYNLDDVMWFSNPCRSMWYGYCTTGCGGQPNISCY